MLDCRLRSETKQYVSTLVNRLTRLWIMENTGLFKSTAVLRARAYASTCGQINEEAYAAEWNQAGLSAQQSLAAGFLAHDFPIEMLESGHVQAVRIWSLIPCLDHSWLMRCGCIDTCIMWAVMEVFARPPLQFCGDSEADKLGQRQHVYLCDKCGGFQVSVFCRHPGFPLGIIR